MKFTYAAAFAAVVLSLVLGSMPLQAHEGHDHAEQLAPVSQARIARGEAASTAFEAVAVGKGDELAIWLDRFATNEPVEGAAIQVETPDGPVAAIAKSGEAYRLKGAWLTKPGQVDLILTVTAGETTDILPLTLTIPDPAATAQTALQSPPLSQSEMESPAMLVLTGVAIASFMLGMFVSGRSRRASVILLLCLGGVMLGASPVRAHEGHDHAAQPPLTSAATGELAQRLPDGSIFVPKATQRIFAVRTLPTAESVYPRRLELPGRVIPDPNASGRVQAAVGGRISPPPGGFPQLGARIKAGAVLAYVTPPLQAIDVSDMRQRQGELDQQIAIVQRRLSRFETLAASPTQAVSRVQLEEVRLELQGLKDRRAALDRISRDPEALVAPVSGIVADANAVAGQMAQPDAVIFQIVDPVRLWVEALSFEQIDGAPAASARTAAGKDLQLAYRGAGYADRNQSLPVHFSIEGEPAGLRPGQFVTVLVATDQQNKGIAVPRSSVVRSANGQSVVFEHASAETFKPRPVRTAPLDGERVLISSGLTPGLRVVTQGAELLDQVR